MPGIVNIQAYVSLSLCTHACISESAAPNLNSRTKMRGTDASRTKLGLPRRFLITMPCGIKVTTTTLSFKRVSETQPFSGTCIFLNSDHHVECMHAYNCLISTSLWMPLWPLEECMLLWQSTRSVCYHELRSVAHRVGSTIAWWAVVYTEGQLFICSATLKTCVLYRSLFSNESKLRVKRGAMSWLRQLCIICICVHVHALVDKQKTTGSHVLYTSWFRVLPKQALNRLSTNCKLSSFNRGDVSR